MIEEPKKPRSLEQILAEQANDAIKQGADPRAATDMLGRMVRHIRANPALAQQGADAIAQGADPGAVAHTVWQLAQGAQPQEQPGLLARTGHKIADAAVGLVTHPEKLLTAPIEAAGRAVIAPSVGDARPDARLSKGGNSSGRAIDTSPYDANHGAVTGRERASATAQTIANIALPGIASSVGKRLAGAGVNELLANAVGVGVGGAAVGVASDPTDPIASALAGFTTGAGLGVAVPPIVRAAGSAGSKGITAFGLRPSGLTAEEAAADAASMPNATPIHNEAARPSGQPTAVDRVKAIIGKKAEQAGIESAKTRALREVARRFALDKVTPADATAFAERAGDKPVGVLDLGDGNVAGLARTAKDVPSVARKLIRDFLEKRSRGEYGDEGQTLKRITGDVEKQLGLSPEDYYATLEDMVKRQKATAAKDYGAIRSRVVDDPEVLKLFNEPEFRAVHEAIRRNARLRGNNDIPSLEAAPTEKAVTVRDGSGRLRSDLSKVAETDLDAEYRRLAELNSKEEALHGSVRDAGYREDYEALPHTEKYGHKGKEDLPDADGAVDPEVLSADNKVIANYNRSQIVRAARSRAMQRIEAELKGRPPTAADGSFDYYGDNAGDDSFEFGANAGQPKGSKVNPQTLGTLDKLKRHLDQIIGGKIDGGPIQRDAAGSMRERLNDILGRMDTLYPEYGQARANYRGSAELQDAYATGKDEFWKLDPRALRAKIEGLPERQRDFYRRGAYDDLRTRLSKMDDASNIAAFLEKSPDIRDRLAALAKAPEHASALRGNLNIERAMGERKNQILGGPNTAERIIEHSSTVPRVTHAGNLARMLPGVGKFAGGLLDNAVTRRTAEQTADVMGEVGKIMTRSGKPGIQQTMSEIDKLMQNDAFRREFMRVMGNYLGAQSAAPASRR